MSNLRRIPARPVTALAILLFSTAGALHCGGGTSGVSDNGDGGGSDGSVHDDGGAGNDGGHADGGDAAVPPGTPPANHRPTPLACPTTRPAGLNADAGFDSGFPTECSRDSDCTQGQNGRCLPSQGNAAGDFCTYDSCFTDNDCADGGVCQCGTTISQVGSDGTPMRTGNRCVNSNCRIDSNCASGYCSPSFDTFCGPRNGIQAYDCHVTGDECNNDSDCTNGINGYCAYQSTVGHWVCSYGACAG